MERKNSTIALNVSGYSRRVSQEVQIGNVAMGAKNPIRLQSMTTTNTNNTLDTAEQCIKIIEAGGHYVRITAQGVKEAMNLGEIKQELLRRGYHTPLIADIHFNPNAAIEAAKHVEKVRINPGNYSDKRILSEGFEYSEKDYNDELVMAEVRIIPLLEVCKQNNVSIRVGVNHGSLSDRIMSRYGDTPMGMAQSAMEFLKICVKHNFNNLVVSMKSSNTRVMVQATRTLVMLMDQEDMLFPLHLGVTEAGEGEDGRIKSAVGIATLLADGLGDTIRVSLTEDPELEIPVAKLLVDHFERYTNMPQLDEKRMTETDPTLFERRNTNNILNVGGDNPPVVIANLSQNSKVSELDISSWGWHFDKNNNQWEKDDDAADYILIGKSSTTTLPLPKELPLIGSNSICRFPLLNINQIEDRTENTLSFVMISIEDITPNIIYNLRSHQQIVPIIFSTSKTQFYAIRFAVHKLSEASLSQPIIARFLYDDIATNDFAVIAAADAGPLFVDGLCNGLMISASANISQKSIRNTSFGILQASRERVTKTEFISCPGCGRTLFNLNETLRRVKSQTAHLKGLKIGVMGCIVNGPGEMADADYGYVGAGQGRVNLYRKREVVKKNIPEDRAVSELINLIKENGDWVENLK